MGLFLGYFADVGYSVSLDNTIKMSDTDYVTYPGGKSGSGVYQQLINLMPPHKIYIEAFLGGGAIMPVSYTHLTLPTNREV